MTTHDGKVPLESNMQPNRKARRAQQRQANRNHAKKLGERKRYELKKGRKKPFVPMHARGDSVLTIQFDRVICNVNRAIKFLCVVGTTLLKLIMISFKVLVAYSSGTEASTAHRKPRSDAVIDEMATSLTEEAATSDISRHSEESTSEEVSRTRHSLPFSRQLCARSWPLTEQLKRSIWPSQFIQRKL
jgi:hypothetical protein